jgi:uncharacterized SAM-binding protein YcdF (DUF218 family)
MLELSLLILFILFGTFIVFSVVSTLVISNIIISLKHKRYWHISKRHHMEHLFIYFSFILIMWVMFFNSDVMNNILTQILYILLFWISTYFMIHMEKEIDWEL